MRPRYSFSSRRTRKLGNIRKQRQEYPDLAERIIEEADIILEVLDTRFIKDSRNIEVEEKIKKKGKKIIYVINKSDLIKEKSKLILPSPSVLISCKNRTGIKSLRDLIKRKAKQVKNPKNNLGKIVVGVLGYPNTGKSSIINLLIGKSSAGVGSDAGFTKTIQKLRLSENILLLDSPGVIPKKDYSGSNIEKISKHTKIGGRSFSQVKEPEIIVQNLMKEYPEIFEKFYNVDAKGNSEILIEKLGKTKGFIKKGNKVDEDKTARLILKDWQTGKIKV